MNGCRNDVTNGSERSGVFRHGPQGRVLLAAAAVVGCLASSGALAYVGPGAGLTLLSALWGLVVAVILALGFVVLWPIRRWRRRRAAGRAGAGREPAAAVRSSRTADTPDAASGFNGRAERNGEPHDGR